MDESISRRYTSRKFWLCVGLTILFTLLNILGNVSEWPYIAAVGWAWTWYVGGNAAEYFAKR